LANRQKSCCGGTLLSTAAVSMPERGSADTATGHTHPIMKTSASCRSMATE